MQIKHSIAALTIAAALSAGANPAAAAPEWAKDAVDTLQRKGIMRDVNNGNRATTRYELVQMLERIPEEQARSLSAAREELEHLRKEILDLRSQLRDLQQRVGPLQQKTDAIDKRS